ncbi:MAG TPA: M48 family metallopeptidase [Phycisphaerales bacterium]|nr:M48 family metallopeptidase [Phycisphaerales bacterium]
MLDFFEQQAKAKHRTGLLVALYILGVCVFVAVVAPVMMALAVSIASFMEGDHRGSMTHRPDRWGLVAHQLFSNPSETFGSPEGRFLWLLAGGGRLALVFGASLWRTSVLKMGGGRVVAESLGGRLVVSGAHDFYDQRLLNVVEEMAIASGVSVPPVYMLDDEDGVNAFAAGYSPSDAVVTVTRGAARSLTREQLQGVIAHEFSHILNGDMRLNIRLIGLLYGILAVMLLGKVFFQIARGAGRAGGRDSGKAAIFFFLFGLAFVILGATGAFVARIVKAAIGRECEYMADASSAQFTRNPGSLAGALRVVGGMEQRGYLGSSQAEEYSHLYFVQGVQGWLAGAMDSHPPLEKRIRLLDPSWDGTWLAPAESGPGVPVGLGDDRAMGLAGGRPGNAWDATPSATLRPAAPAPSVSIAAATVHTGSLTPEEVFARVESARELLGSLPPSLLASARNTHDARALVLAMLLDSRAGAGTTRQQQLDLIAQNLDAGTAQAAAAMDDVLRGLAPGARMPLLGVALGALASLSPDQYAAFRLAIDRVVAAGRHTNLFHICVQRMLAVHLDRRFGAAKPPTVQYYALTRLGEELSTLLSATAMVAALEGAPARSAVTGECNRLGVGGGRLLERREITPVRLLTALAVLATAAPRLRVQVVRACAEIIGQDGKVTAEEAELLRAVADGLDVPLAMPSGD